MRNRTAWTLVVLPLLAALPVHLAGQTPEPEMGADELEALARTYIATLDRDLERQAEFYTPDTHFVDPTSAQFGPAWDFRGGEAILEFFRTASEDYGTLEVDYRITSIIVESPLVIATITSTVTSCAVALDYPGKSFTGDIHMVMILDFDGRKLRKRTDYVGYSAAWEEMERIRLGLQEEEDDPRCTAQGVPPVS